MFPSKFRGDVNLEETTCRVIMGYPPVKSEDRMIVAGVVLT